MRGETLTDQARFASGPFTTLCAVADKCINAVVICLGIMRRKVASEPLIRPLTRPSNQIKLCFHLPHTSADGPLKGLTADSCEKGGRHVGQPGSRLPSRSSRVLSVL